MFLFFPPSVSDSLMDSSKAMYALEDILGGFAAVGSMTVRMLTDLAKNPEVQERIREEIDGIETEQENKAYALKNGENLHWTRYEDCPCNDVVCSQKAC